MRRARGWLLPVVLVDSVRTMSRRMTRTRTRTRVLRGQAVEQEHLPRVLHPPPAPLLVVRLLHRLCPGLCPWMPGTSPSVCCRPAWRSATSGGPLLLLLVWQVDLVGKAEKKGAGALPGVG